MKRGAVFGIDIRWDGAQHRNMIILDYSKQAQEYSQRALAAARRELKRLKDDPDTPDDLSRWPMTCWLGVDLARNCAKALVKCDRDTAIMYAHALMTHHQAMYGVAFTRRTGMSGSSRSRPKTSPKL